MTSKPNEKKTVRPTVAYQTHRIQELEDIIDEATEELATRTAFREELIARYGADDGSDPEDGISYG